MKIERIDDTTIKCFLSNEELEQYDIDYKDFVMHNDKAKEVVQEIMEQAQEEVGYKPPKFAFEIQIMVMPDMGLMLTFSEKNTPDGQIMDCFREIKRLLQQAKDELEMSADQNQPAVDAHAAKRKRAKWSEKDGNPDEPTFALFGFSSLRNVMNYAASLPKNLRVESKLYEMDGDYYLALWKGHASRPRFNRACVEALEFSGLCTADENQTGFLKEHGTCLIEEKALRKLQK